MQFPFPQFGIQIENCHVGFFTAPPSTNPKTAHTPASRTARNRRTSCGAYANTSGNSSNKFNRW